MSFNRYNPNSRYQKRRADTIIRFFKSCVFISVVILVGFWLGKQYTAKDYITNKDQLKNIKIENEQLLADLTKSTAENKTLSIRYQQLQQEFNETLPSDGPMRGLLTLVQQQLDKGMAPERLKFAIQAARPPTDCSDVFDRNFLVSTPGYKGEGGSVSIANNAIKIMASGYSAMNKNGDKEAWFDPQKKVKISFEYDGKKEQKSRILPLQHSIISDGREYRITVSKSVKSYAKITYDSCAYP